MPQEPTPAWERMLGPEWKDTHGRLLHTFGNLTLTGYNAEMGNLPFDEKRTQLSNSHIELNRWICQQEKWDADVIGDRGRMLAERACSIWLGPESVSSE